MKKVIKKSIAFVLTVVMAIGLLSVGASAAPAEGTFTDISGSKYADMIEALAAAGIVQGTGDSKFSPDKPATRAAAVTMLGRLAGATEEKANTFSDVASGSWYAGFMGWAANNGILLGDGKGHALPDETVTGKQMDLMLSRYAKLAGFTYSPIDHAQTKLTRGELAMIIYSVYVQSQQPATATYSIDVSFEDMFGTQPAVLTINTKTLQWTLAYENMYGAVEIGGWYDDADFSAEITNDAGQGQYLPKEAILAAVSAGTKQIYSDHQLARPVYSTDVSFEDMFGTQPAVLTINTKTLQWTLAYENMYGAVEIGGWYDDADFSAEITNDAGQGQYLPKEAILAAVSAGIKQLYNDNHITSGSGEHVHRFADGVCTVCGYECPHPQFNANGACTTCYWLCPHTEHDQETRICKRCGQVCKHVYDEETGYCSCGKAGGNVDEYRFTSVKPMENSPMKDKTLCVLGSSVVFGAGSKEEAVGEYFAARFGCKLVKEAVSGTTLADNGADSYVQRMLNNLDKDAQYDLFICQLSTNDATQNVPMGEISDSKELSAFDTATVTGAMEYIICYAQENWGCPIVFFTNSRYDSAQYGQMVVRLHELEDKWGIGVLDLWSDEAFNDITDEQMELYMHDLIHPTKAGYRDWWGPELEKQLLDYLA